MTPILTAVDIALAEAQFIGYFHGKKGFSLRELCSSMALRRSEWHQIKNLIKFSKEDTEEIEEYLK